MEDGTTQPIRIEVAAQQDQGRVRERQEDSCLAHLVEDRPAALLVVADGMGGHQGGDVASRAAVQAVAQALLPVMKALQPVPTLRLPDESEASPVAPTSHDPLRTVKLSQETVLLDGNIRPEPQWQELLGAAVQSAHLAVRAAAAQIDALGDAGCTLTLGVIIGYTLHLAHVGDSRAYLWRQSQLRQLTNDHSGAAALVAAGLITPEEARTHPVAHQLYRFLGGEAKSAKPDIQQVRLEAGDRLLFCSDGLWDMVKDAELAMLQLKASSLADLAQAFIDTANAAGGEDNISAVLAEIVS